MAGYTRKTITLSERKVVNTAQKIQRDYYNKMREFMATASDEQIQVIAKAIGQADTLAAFAVEQEMEAREEKMLGFTVFEKPAPEADEATGEIITDANGKEYEVGVDDTTGFVYEPGTV